MEALERVGCGEGESRGRKGEGGPPTRGDGGVALAVALAVVVARRRVCRSRDPLMGAGGVCVCVFTGCGVLRGKGGYGRFGLQGANDR